MFPELALAGYPPEDLILKKNFLKDNAKKINEIKNEIGNLSAVVGFVDYKNGTAYNALALIHKKKIIATYYKNQLPNYGVFDEKRYFTVDEPLERSKAEAAILRNYFMGLPVRVGFWAGQLRLIYYIDPLLAVECSTGLTDTAVAHQSISARGRPGHEKNASLSYLMHRKVNFYLGPTDPPPPGELVLNLITFKEFQARIIIYENAIMERLATYPEVKFVRMPAYLDAYIREMKAYPREKIEQDYQFFKAYYFDHNADTLRQGAILAFLKE
jgi:hypothetical protein